MTIANDYIRGLTIPEIMAKYGASRMYIYAALKEEGIVLRNRRVSPEDVNKVCKRYAKGDSIVQIARRYGLTRQRVHYIIKKHYDKWTPNSFEEKADE